MANCNTARCRLRWRSRAHDNRPYMFWLMFRNVASDGFVFEDRRTRMLSPARLRARLTVVENTAHVDQDYVYNWTRDAATVAIELAAGTIPLTSR